MPRLKIQGLADDQRFFLYFALQAMRLARLLVYAPGVPADKQAGLPFVEFVDSPEQAVARARRLVKGQASVLVFPHGGMTYPSLLGARDWNIFVNSPLGGIEP